MNRQSLERVFFPQWKKLGGDVLFSLKMMMAATSALYVAFVLNLPQPYWALVTVVIIAQPYSGMIRSKALYRIIGTVAGASFIVLTMPVLINSPELFSLTLCLWIAFCLFLSLYDGSPRSYGFILGGYTAALIGFPTVDSPGNIFLVARTRVEEVVLGVLATYLVNELFFPREVTPLLLSRIDRWMSGVAKWGKTELSEQTVLRRIPHDLGAEISVLSGLQIHATYESVDPRIQGWLSALLVRMRDLLPILADIGHHQRVLSRISPGIFQEFLPFGKEMIDWMAGVHHASSSEMESFVRTFFASRSVPLEGDGEQVVPTELGVLIERLFERYIDLVHVWGECRRMRRLISHGGVEDPPPASPVRVSAFRDPLLPFLSALAVSLAVLFSILIWRGTDWPEGFAAAMMAAVSGTFFVAMDDPSVAIMDFLAKINLGSIVGLFVLFVLLPRVHDFPGLMVILSFVLFPAGLLLAKPDGPLKVLPFMIGFSGLIAVQSTYRADFAYAWNTAVAESTGVYLAALATVLVRSVGVRFSIRRILASIHHEILSLSQSQGVVDRQVFTSRMFDRIAPLMTRMGALGENERADISDGLFELVVGLELIRLQEIREKVPEPFKDSLSRFMTVVGESYNHPVVVCEEEQQAVFDEVFRAAKLIPETGIQAELFSAVSNLHWTLWGAVKPLSSRGGLY